jgi:lipopolysaccharide export system permease protein
MLRRLPGPFFGWLSTLMFLLVIRFLMKWLPKIAGKGIPVLVIIELISYNLAYMIMLAVPMSVLLAVLMAFSRLVESNYYTAIKSTGVSVGQVVWPALVAGVAVMGGMLYFNNVMLPEANHRARQLWGDIRSKRPGFEIQPGVFYDGIENYSILVQKRLPGTNKLIDVTIYDYTQGRERQAVIKAERGMIESGEKGARLTLTLRNGEMHRLLRPDDNNENERYEKLNFDRHQIKFDLPDAVFRRSDDGKLDRSPRTTRLPQLLGKVDSLESEIGSDYRTIQKQLQRTIALEGLGSAKPETMRLSQAPGSLAVPYAALTGLDGKSYRSVGRRAAQTAQQAESIVESAEGDLKWKKQLLWRYEVELQKKFSLAFACLLFVVMGASLGLALGEKGLGTIGSIALGIFMFYWICLVQGMKLAQSGFLPPWLGMWIGNIIMSGVGVWLTLYVALDLGATPPLRRRLQDWIKSFR